MSRVKHSTLAGAWYEKDAARLSRQIDELLIAAAAPQVTAVPIGLVVPHAGYIYSGRAAAAGYACLRDTPYRRAVILGPSHFTGFRGAATLDVDCFETPLGSVVVDRAGLMAMIDQPLCREYPGAFRDEHSIEIQLPLLQCVLPNARIVPLLVGAVSAADAVTLAGALRRLVDNETVFIVSSDFVHYGRRFDYLPFPAAGPEAVRAGLRDLDMRAIERVCAGDSAGFRRYVEETGATICGRNPLSVFLTLGGCGTGQLLSYYTSLDVTGDYEHCVSYASIAFPRGA